MSRSILSIIAGAPLWPMLGMILVVGLAYAVLVEITELLDDRQSQPSVGLGIGCPLEKHDYYLVGEPPGDLISYAEAKDLAKEICGQ